MKTAPNRYSSTLSHPPCEPGPVTKPSPPSPNGSHEPLVIVDAANVVGSVPDGWWRDRRRATERLRDQLPGVAASGLPALASVPDWATRGPVDLVLVVEGQARAVGEVPGVRVVRAERSGDDAIVDLVRAAENRDRLVITADRGLRDRVIALGADVVGPHAVRRAQAGRPAQQSGNPPQSTAP